MRARAAGPGTAAGAGMKGPNTAAGPRTAAAAARGTPALSTGMRDPEMIDVLTYLKIYFCKYASSKTLCLII